MKQQYVVITAILVLIIAFCSIVAAIHAFSHRDITSIVLPAIATRPALTQQQYKDTAIDTDINTLSMAGNEYIEEDIHFKGMIVSFIKNRSGAKLTDNSGSYVQVLFDLSINTNKLHVQDNIEIWGTDEGKSFNGEVVIKEKYLSPG